MLKPRILCIDDEPSIGEMVRMLFEETGDFLVETVTDPYAALPQAKRFQPDVFLLDISMPGQDGYAVARQIREEPGLRHRPILFYSGNKEVIEAALRAASGGPADFLQKGLPVNTLESAVRSLTAERLERYHSDRQVRQKTAS